MGFRFSLATILRLRESVEKREESALNSILLEISNLQRAIDELNIGITKRSERLQVEMKNSLEAKQMQLSLNEINAAVEWRRELLLMLEEMQQRKKEQMKQYRAAVRGRLMLTEMRAQQRKEYEQKQERTQQKFLDDIFASRKYSD